MPNMNNLQRGQLLAAIADAQAGTAPVTVQIGYVAESGQCRGQGVVITKAPATVYKAAQAWASDNGILVDITLGGLFFH